MSFDPNKISQKHVLDAVARIEKEGLKLIDSTKYDVIINGRKYPPKEIMRLARFEYDGDDFWKYGGGSSTNKYLEKMGFKIIDKGQSLPQNFKKSSVSEKKTSNYGKMKNVNFYIQKMQNVN